MTKIILVLTTISGLIFLSLSFGDIFLIILQFKGTMLLVFSIFFSKQAIFALFFLFCWSVITGIFSHL